MISITQQHKVMLIKIWIKQSRKVRMKVWWKVLKRVLVDYRKRTCQVFRGYQNSLKF